VQDISSIPHNAQFTKHRANSVLQHVEVGLISRIRLATDLQSHGLITKTELNDLKLSLAFAKKILSSSTSLSQPTTTQRLKVVLSTLHIDAALSSGSASTENNEATVRAVADRIADWFRDYSETIRDEKMATGECIRLVLECFLRCCFAAAAGERAKRASLGQKSAKPRAKLLSLHGHGWLHPLLN